MILGMAKFAYNNKKYSSTKVSPFKVNYGQNSRMDFEMRKKEKYKRAQNPATTLVYG